jgi:hypothetical protein
VRITSNRSVTGKEKTLHQCISEVRIVVTRSSRLFSSERKNGDLNERACLDARLRSDAFRNPEGPVSRGNRLPFKPGLEIPAAPASWQ